MTKIVGGVVIAMTACIDYIADFLCDITVTQRHCIRDIAFSSSAVLTLHSCLGHGGRLFGSLWTCKEG